MVSLRQSAVVLSNDLRSSLNKLRPKTRLHRPSCQPPGYKHCFTERPCQHRSVWRTLCNLECGRQTVLPSVSLHFLLYTYVCVRSPVCSFISPSVRPSVRPSVHSYPLSSIWLYVIPFVSLFASDHPLLCTRPSIIPFVIPGARSPVRPLIACIFSPVCTLVCIYIRESVCAFIRPSVCPSVRHPFVRHSVRAFVHLLGRPFVCLSVLSVHLFI